MKSQRWLTLLAVSLGALGCSESKLTDLHTSKQDGSTGSIPVRPAIDTVGLGASVTFVADLADSTTGIGDWTLSDSSVATIVARERQSVTVKALDSGTVTLTANKDGEFGNATLVVLPSYQRDTSVVRITTNLVYRLAVNSALQIGFNGWDAYDDVRFRHPRTITVGDTSIARIDGTGETYVWLRGLRRGMTTVTITMERATACIRIVVGDSVPWNYTACGDNEVPVASISLAIVNDSITAQHYPLFGAFLKDAAGNVLPWRLVDWTVSDTTILKIRYVLDWGVWDWRYQLEGEVLRPGTATITATAEGRTASMTVTFP